MRELGRGLGERLGVVAKGRETLVWITLGVIADVAAEQPVEYNKALAPP
jgi:hypothetical protein